MMDTDKMLKNVLKHKNTDKIILRKKKAEIKDLKEYSEKIKKIKKIKKETLKRKKEYNNKYNIYKKLSLIYFSDAIKEFKNEINKMYPKISIKDKEELILVLLKQLKW